MDGPLGTVEVEEVPTGMVLEEDSPRRGLVNLVKVLT